MVRREANVRCWSGTVVMEFVLFFIWQTSSNEHISVSATPAKLIGNDQTISNGVANFKQQFPYVSSAIIFADLLTMWCKLHGT